MPLAEGSAARFAYKFYADGTMITNAEADIATAPGSTGGRILRRVSAGLNLRKNATRSAEILPSRQVRSSRHTSRRVEGPLDGEFSPGSYFDFIEAAHRDTAAPILPSGLTEVQLTSAAADSTTSKFTFGGGDPVALGLRKGAIIQFASLSAAGNNGVRFLITGFGGTSNREVSVFPAPTTMAADTAFTLSTPGKSSIIPASGHIRRKLAIERYHEDLDRARLYTELRVTGYRLAVPAEGNSTFGLNVMGRNRRTLTGAAAPYFTSPSAATTTEVCNSLNGILRIAGSTVGTVTGLNLNLAMAADAPAVLGQAFPPDVLLGTADVTGDFTALVDDTDAISAAFEDELEVELLFMLTAGGATADAVAFHLPRLKLNGDEENVQGEGSQTMNVPFQALEYLGSAVGMTGTTLRCTDTAAT